ncbi:MAG: T9SS type A sorting domain-containing protein [Flavobacteriales bacterium]|nr:T9SS type A sorting domain-containing protein [Flavobacteriales bacterium]MCB9447253.1 T9SS type A sorting domain-containing protein [Flavobacteriales bacterium]
MMHQIMIVPKPQVRCSSKYLCTLIVCLTSFTCQAQIAWEWLNPLPQGNTLYAFEMIDTNVMYAAGDIGTVLKTTNSGQSWQLTRLDSMARVRDLFFRSEELGWAVTEKGDIFKTTNGGQHWIHQYKAPGEYLSAIHFIDDMNGWATSSFETILHTEDGGENWTVQVSSGNSEAFLDIFFIDSLNGWAYGTGGINLHTSNGGKSWHNHQYVPSMNFRSISFIDAQYGWAAANSSIMATSDSGNTWVEQTTTNGAAANCIHIDPVSKKGWAGVGTGIYRTKNGLKGGWHQMSFSWADQSRQRTKYAMDASDSNHVWIVGRNGQMVRSNTGGLSENTWDIFPYTGLFQGLKDFSFANVNQGWLIDEDNIIWSTDNGGKDWNIYIDPGPTFTSDFNAIDFYDENTALLVGDNNGSSALIWYTFNGAIWQGGAYYNEWPLRDGFILNPGFEAVVGDNGTIGILRDTSGWHFKSYSSYQLRSVFFADTSNGWTVGENGAILHTSNGGDSWKKQPSDTTSDLNDVYFTDPLNGWVVGNNIALHTKDGGYHWAPSGYFEYEDLNRVYFKDPANGIVICATGSIYGTADSGNTWVREPVPMTNQSLRAFAAAGGEYWILGGESILLHGKGDSFVGMKEALPHTNDLPMIIYPVPFHDHAVIQVMDPSLRMASVRLFGINGQIMQQADHLLTNQYMIGNATLPPGAYIVQVTFTNHVTCYRKMIKY